MEIKVEHIKTGNIYYIICEAIECTNGREDLKYIVYKRNADIFVREANEFWQKFRIYTGQ